MKKGGGHGLSFYSNTDNFVLFTSVFRTATTDIET